MAPVLTPFEFAHKWAGSMRPERAAAQEHFTDLCRMLGHPTPNEADPAGDWYAFEKGADKVAGGKGLADVWKRDHFAWEYKGRNKDLKAAYQQLLQYREALGNPPLLVVCDLDRFEVHTNFTGTTKAVHRFSLNDLATAPAEPLRILRAVVGAPYSLRPQETTAELTEKAAGQFAQLASALRGRGLDAQRVAHFLNKLLFCLFAEDAGLLPPDLIPSLAEASRHRPEMFAAGLADLFRTMSSAGGLFGPVYVQWFDGGLFDGPDVVELTSAEILLVRQVSRLDWSQIEPAIFGTLFERGLDPDKRSQMGAHYTDRDSIRRLVEPVLVEPLRRDFASTTARVLGLLANGKRVTRRTQAEMNPEKVFDGYLKRLRSVRVLDPACGSGNFLYVALQALKDLEREALHWASLTLKRPLAFPEVGPHVVRGIEVNVFAAELARVSIWIGEIQWMLGNGFAYLADPVLRPLDTIECRDALLDGSQGTGAEEARWPDADVIVGNPPFLGGKLLRTYLGNEYVDRLFSVFQTRVPAEADLVCYWFEKARQMLTEGRTKRVGLLATQGIRGGANRRVLERVNETGRIFMARSDEPWVLDGAAVHVSFVCFDDRSVPSPELDGAAVPAINANLTAGIDLTRARRLKANLGLGFMGDTKGGPFDVSEGVALTMIAQPNPDERSNADVVKPWVNGLDVTRRPRGKWIIDFGVGMSLREASLYEAPFEHVNEHVKPVRSKNARASYAERWWLHMEPRPAMRQALLGLDRFMGTATVAKHRLFVWLPQGTLPDHQIIVIARGDDCTFGVLHSRVHELWARRQGTQLREVESGFRYTPTTTFETFPFPQATEAQRQTIAGAARELERLRTGWLHPERASEAVLSRRTLTGLYNDRPAWLTEAHRTLDRAVLAAYGWPETIGDHELLARLLELNLSREPVET